MTTDTSHQEPVALVIGILVAVICLLVSAILLICWRARRQKAGNITHDVYTGPYGEKRDVVNLKVRDCVGLDNCITIYRELDDLLLYKGLKAVFLQCIVHLKDTCAVYMITCA